jgi:hypothetical protein
VVAPLSGPHRPSLVIAISKRLTLVIIIKMKKYFIGLISIFKRIPTH